MNESAQSARRVFKKFQDNFQAMRRQPLAEWWESFEDDDAEELGLTPDELWDGLGLLLEKELIFAKSAGYDMMELTDLGRAVCRHPEEFDEIIIITTFQGGRAVANTTNFNAPVGNAQVGDHNTLTVNTTTTVVNHFQQLVQEIQASKAEPEQKSKMLELVKAGITAISPALVAQVFKLAVGG